MKNVNAIYRKEIEPIISTVKDKKQCTGTVIECRLFGILISRKVLHSPEHYGVDEYKMSTHI